MKYDLINDDLINICKTASVQELEELCEEIRQFLVEKVSRTGGHLASNLGIVELSVALMRVLTVPGTASSTMSVINPMCTRF